MSGHIKNYYIFVGQKMSYPALFEELECVGSRPVKLISFDGHSLDSYPHPNSSSMFSYVSSIVTWAPVSLGWIPEEADQQEGSQLTS